METRAGRRQDLVIRNGLDRIVAGDKPFRLDRSVDHRATQRRRRHEHRRRASRLENTGEPGSVESLSGACRGIR
jgi:hypothetical protein